MQSNSSVIRVPETRTGQDPIPPLHLFLGIGVMIAVAVKSAEKLSFGDPLLVFD